MVVGEPGIGKTRTMEEFTAHARERGARVLWGRCYEGEGAPPYGPFAEAIGEYATRIEVDELRADLSQFGAAVAGIAPLLGERVTFRRSRPCSRTTNAIASSTPSPSSCWPRHVAHR